PIAISCCSAPPSAPPPIARRRSWHWPIAGTRRPSRCAAPISRPRACLRVRGSGNSSPRSRRGGKRATLPRIAPNASPSSRRGWLGLERALERRTHRGERRRIDGHAHVADAGDDLDRHVRPEVVQQRRVSLRYDLVVVAPDQDNKRLLCGAKIAGKI